MLEVKINCEETSTTYWDGQYDDSMKQYILLSQSLFAKVFRFLRKVLYKSPLESKIKKIALNNTVKVALEAGCGTGSFVFSLTGIPTIKYCVGVDFSKSAIDIAAKRSTFHRGEVRDKASFLLSDIRKLPFKDDTFDLMLSLGVLEHFKDPSLLLAEMKRVLKPNGVLFLQVPNRNAFGLTEERSKTAVQRTGYHDFYTPKELSSLVSNGGFRINKAYSDDFAWGLSIWYIDFIAPNLAPHKGLLSYIHWGIGAFIYASFRPLDPFMKHRGFHAIIEAEKI